MDTVGTRVRQGRGAGGYWRGLEPCPGPGPELRPGPGAGEGAAIVPGRGWKTRFSINKPRRGGGRRFTIGVRLALMELAAACLWTLARSLINW